MIGANSVVNKSVTENGVTVAGVPAKIVGLHSSRPYLNKRLFENDLWKSVLLYLYIIPIYRIL